MSTKQATITICDQCNKHVEDDGKIRYGGDGILHGWITVTERNFSSMIHSDSIQKRGTVIFDFCGEECLKKHYKI